MKLLALTWFLLALCSSAVQVAVYPSCTGVAASCRRLPLATAKKCSSIITKQRVPIATCQYPKQTVTRTETEYPFVTSTRTIRATTVVRTVTSTTTKSRPTVTLAPTTTVRTQTSTKTTTLTTTSVSTSTSITTTTGLTTEFSTSTTVTRSTTYSSYVQETCPPVVIDGKRDLSEIDQRVDDIAVSEPQSPAPQGSFEQRRRAEPFPDDCSCYLTSTKLDPRAETKTITVTRPIVETSTTIVGGTAPTVTRTSTIVRTTTAAGTSFVRSTVTSTSTTTLSQTSYTGTTTVTTVFSTSTTSSTSTSVVSTSTQIEYEQGYSHPCIDRLRGRVTVPYKLSGARPNQVFDLTWPNFNVESCCYVCFNNNNCAYWGLKADGMCVFGIIAAEQNTCKTGWCPTGFPDLLAENPAPGDTWGVGRCAGPMGT